MRTGEDDDLERGGDDMLAAEYVLGVLPSEDRLAVIARIASEPDFARLVEAWEVRFSPLNAGYEDIAPPAHVKAALDERLFGSAQMAPAPARAGLLHSLAFWRGLTAAAVAALLLVLALPFFEAPAPVQPAERFAASLADDETDVGYLAVYDAEVGEIALSRIGSEREAGRDFELWAIEGEDPPVSLGVIPAGENARFAVTPELRDLMASGVLFAVSEEPEGGSPTGQPTGPVVAAGELRTI